MIELAPHNPYGLALRSPVIVAPGCADVGLPRDIDPAIIGAIATRTATLHTSRARRGQWGRVPAGVVFEQLPAISLRQLLKTEAKRWGRMAVPVLLSLRGTHDELLEMIIQLEFAEAIGGVLVTLDEADSAPLEPSLAALRAQTPLPLVVQLPVTHAVVEHAARAAAAGADALVIGGYPQAAAVMNGAFVQGMLVGPTLAPWTLQALHGVAQRTELPLIAYGGVADERIAQHCLQAGATAVMCDGALYGDPFAPQRIGTALRDYGARNAANDAATA